jgi:outer membrane receptor for ferrienterochelin and colicins
MVSLNAEYIHQLDDFVVTTATKSGRLVSDVPIRTEVMNLDEFRCFNISELGESIDHYNGIRTESNCQNCGCARVP